MIKFPYYRRLKINKWNENLLKKINSPQILIRKNNREKRPKTFQVVPKRSLNESYLPYVMKQKVKY